MKTIFKAIILWNDDAASPYDSHEGVQYEAYGVDPLGVCDLLKVAALKLAPDAAWDTRTHADAYQGISSTTTVAGIEYAAFVLPITLEC